MLSRIKKIDLREIWKHEAHDFTKWLAKKENIEILSEEIGLDINILQTEANIGNFSADILAEEENTGKKIIIENQLETTDHNHLGQIITYASGIEANYIIWIFKEIRDEHRKAIDWLNDITDKDLNIFAIKMELWQIDDSKPAPKFQIISSPNDWAKVLRASNRTENLSASNLFQLNYWSEFANFLSEKSNTFKPRKPRGQHWYDLRIGNSQAHISLVISVQNNFLRSEIYITDNMDLFFKLISNKNAIEQELDLALEWHELPNAKASRISITKNITNIKNPNTIKSSHKWFLEMSEKFFSVFPKYW